MRTRCLLLLTLVLSVACAHPRPPGGTQPLYTQQRIALDGHNPFGVVAADFNGDGRLDLMVSNAASETLSLLQGSNGTFTPAAGWPVGALVSRGMVAADLNGDQHPDLVVANVNTSGVFVFLADGHGGATRKSFYSGLAPFNVALADVNGDGHLDIAVANESNISVLENHGQVAVLFGDGHGDFPRRLDLEGGSYPSDVKIADLNGDGFQDLAVLNWKSQDVSLFLGDGRGVFAPPRSVPYGGVAAYSLVIVDLNRDGRPDIAVADLQGYIWPLYNDGTGGFARQPPLAVGAGARTLVAADLNGDSVIDLVTADTAANTLTLLLGKAAGGFAAPQRIEVGKQPRVVTPVDLNSDGRLDLVVTNGGSDDISVLMNTGAGR